VTGRDVPEAMTGEDVWACRAGVDLIGLYGIDAPRFRPLAVPAARWGNVETAHAVLENAPGASLWGTSGGHVDSLSRCPG
jgi:hypothetical protein